MNLLSVILQVATTAVVDLSFWKVVGACLGAGITTFSAAIGISKIATAALESTARQPEVSGDLRSSMIITAAFIEGAAFFSLVICLLAALL